MEDLNFSENTFNIHEQKVFCALTFASLIDNLVFSYMHKDEKYHENVLLFVLTYIRNTKATFSNIESVLDDENFSKTLYDTVQEIDN